MRGFIGIFISMIVGFGILNPAVAAERVVVCEEFYQEF